MDAFCTKYVQFFIVKNSQKVIVDKYCCFFMDKKLVYMYIRVYVIRYITTELLHKSD